MTRRGRNRLGKRLINSSCPGPGLVDSLSETNLSLRCLRKTRASTVLRSRVTV